MADLAILQARLAEAEEAYHKLSVGRLPVTLRQPDGKFVTYNVAKLGDLSSYVAYLRSQVAALTGSAAGRRSPIYARF